jgi:hypothetical protein
MGSTQQPGTPTDDQVVPIAFPQVSPDEVSTLAELAAALRALQAASGLTYRELEQRSDHLLRRSTISDMLSGHRVMPAWETVKAFVAVCQGQAQAGGIGMDCRESAWFDAWRRARTTTAAQPSAGATPDADQESSLSRAIEAEATATATVIAGLRWRLQRQETLEHPEVMRELGKLEEQITTQLKDAYPSPGRHRSTADTAISRQTSDAFGDDLKPNPITAAAPEEFIDALRQYRAWSGDPSWRTIAKQSGHTVVYSTIWNAINGTALPKLEVVKAIVVGCGGGEDDLNSFVSAWRRIALSRARDSFRAVKRRS